MNNPTDFLILLSSKSNEWIRNNANLIQQLDDKIDEINWNKVFQHYKNIKTPLAIYLIGYMFNDGLGIKQNHAKAYDHYKIIANKGYKIANNDIDYLLKSKIKANR